MIRSSIRASRPARSTGRAQSEPSKTIIKSGAATSSSPGTGSRGSFERRERDTGKNETDAGEVVPARVFGEEQRRQDHAERRHEVHRDARAHRSHALHYVAPACIGEQERT